MSVSTRHSPGTARDSGLRRSALLALSPAAIAVALIAWQYGATPLDFLPIWTDEVVYWNEAAAFSEAGFNGGYITVHEQAPPAAFSRFGAHGPSFAVFHGSVGRIAGWHPWSAFAINLIVVSLAAFVWFRAGPARRPAAAAFLVLTFWPLMLYLPTNMQEPTHFALAFLFALAIERHAAGSSLKTLVWTSVLLAAAVMLRPTWALMVLPLGWRRARHAGVTGVVALMVVTVAMATVSYYAFDRLASPGYQNNLRRVAEAWADTPGRAVAMTINRASLNVRLLFATTEDEPPEIAFRYFLAALIVTLAVCRVMARRRHDRAVVLETALLVILPVFAIVLVVGEVESWRDFRLLAPHVLVALLLLAVHGGWERWLWAGTLVALPAYVDGFNEFHQERFTTSHEPIAAMRQVAGERLPFRPGASPWANTVLVHAELLQYPLLGLPPGIGVSYVADWSNLPSTVRSHYVLLRPQDREEIGERLPLTAIAETPLGTLYRNAP